MFWFGLATPAVQRRYFTDRLLADRRVPFIVTELGVYTDRFMLHLFVALAEKERAICRRTRDSLAAAKARGVQLGGYRTQSSENQRKAAAHADRTEVCFEEPSGYSARPLPRSSIGSAFRQPRRQADSRKPAYERVYEFSLQHQFEPRVR